MGEPLYEEVAAVLKDADSAVKLYACRFGLAGKDTTPAQIATIFDNMENADPKNHYTIGIVDDVTFKSIPYGPAIDTIPEGTVSCKFWGLGSDGTVGANKNTIKIIGDHTDLQVQAYFEYDGKKSGGVTRSHLRFGKNPIKSAYLVNQADFAACHNQAYVSRYDLVRDIKNGGSLLLSCEWDFETLDDRLPAAMKRAIAEKKIRLYLINSADIASKLGLGNRTNTVLQAAFFKITGIIPLDEAVKYMKEAIFKTYGNKGESVINMNYAAVDAGIERVIQVEIPSHWKTLEPESPKSNINTPGFIRDILEPVNNMNGDDIPVSVFADIADGTMPYGTAAYEKRGIAAKVPVWKDENCIQCNQCAYVCPHAAIRPLLLTTDEAKRSPGDIKTVTAKGKGAESYLFHIGVSVLDCAGCGSCVNVCPRSGKALVMEPLESQLGEAEIWDYTRNLPEIRNPFGTSTVKGVQFEQSLLEFPGACAGCGETPYAKLITQLFGDRMYIATATGCSQVWATSFPSFPYTINKQGKGPAVAGSLFENNAEFGMGIYLGVEQQRQELYYKVKELAVLTQDQDLKDAASAWINGFDDKNTTKETSRILLGKLENHHLPEENKDVSYRALHAHIRENAKHLVKKSVWIFGGDGWAYDIGYGGLDHVLASGLDVNVLVFDTEVYSNTGGQASKATPSGAVAQFAVSGKKTKKKDLGRMIMTYGNIYVAQVSMGANQTQLLKAVKEAEEFNGPSVIIAYSPCINHGLRCGMNKVQDEMKAAVEAGYWHLYRYNPDLKKEGKNPFQLDSAEPNGDYQKFLRGEVRYSALERSFPDEAKKLFEKSEEDAKERYAHYKALGDSQSGGKE
jgi:pyruvate-ferredoxin/flavodoxin oxidoreductase